MFFLGHFGFHEISYGSFTPRFTIISFFQNIMINYVRTLVSRISVQGGILTNDQISEQGGILIKILECRVKTGNLIHNKRDS